MLWVFCLVYFTFSSLITTKTKKTKWAYFLKASQFTVIVYNFYTILNASKQTHLVMAGLEGAPSAVESHLHRGESQIGHKILTTLRIAVLHLDRGRQIK